MAGGLGTRPSAGHGGGGGRVIEATPILMDFRENYGADRADMEDEGDREPDDGP